MTSQSDRIQSLVEQINTILHDASADGEPITDEYQILEQTRQRLSQLQGPSLPPMVATSMATNEIPANESGPNETAITVQDWQAPAPVLAESAQQVLQAIVQEMAYLRMNTVQPLREEIVRLQQERNYLASEVQQLQHQRYQLVLAQQTDQQQMINGFLHALMERLQEQLALQVAQTIAKLEGRSGTTLVSAGDANVMQLDSTLQVVFDSLQTNINTHQASLEASLQKMQGLGQQGEAMFTAFVNRLASRLGQEASQYLQPTQPVPPEENLADAAAWDRDGSSDQPPQADQPPSVPLANSLSQLVTGVQADESDSIELTTEEFGAGEFSTGEFSTGEFEVVEDETTVDPSFSIPGAGSITADEPVSEATETWPQGSATPPFGPQLDSVSNDGIDNPETKTIQTSPADAPLETLDVSDNLDLGFGLDSVKLEDVPADQAELSTLLQDADLTAERVPSLLESDSPGQDVLGQVKITNTEDSAELSPPVLAPPEGLTAPLQPIATIQLDNDDIDVDRLLNVINTSSSEESEDLPTEDISTEDISTEDISTEDISTENLDGLSQASPEADPSMDTDEALSLDSIELGAATEIAPDDVDLLRQQLAAELQDEIIDEQLFDSNQGLQLPDNVLSASESAPTMDQPDSGISFTITPPSSETRTSEPWDDEDNSGNDGNNDGNNDAAIANRAESSSSDFYGAFGDDVDFSSSPDLFDGDTLDGGSPNDQTASAESTLADDGISDSWSQWIDDAEASAFSEPEEPEDNPLSALLEPDEFEAEATDLPPVEDTIHRLTDLTQKPPTEPSLSSDATLKDHTWMNQSTALFADELPLVPPTTGTDQPEDLFPDAEPTAGGWIETQADADAETATGANVQDLTPVSTMLDDLFSGDPSTDDPPTPAQAIAKPIPSSFISEPPDSPESSEDSVSLFDQFEQVAQTEDSATNLFGESLDTGSLDTGSPNTGSLDGLQDDIGELGSAFLSESSNLESSSSESSNSVPSISDLSADLEDSTSLFDQFDQPTTGDTDTSPFDESSETESLDILPDGMGGLDSLISESSTDSSSLFEFGPSGKGDDSTQSLFEESLAESSDIGSLNNNILQDDNDEQTGENTGLTNLLEELQQDGSSTSGALSDAEEAKTLADLLRGQSAYLGRQPAKTEPEEESRAVPPPVPSDSDPFSNWFGAESEEIEGTEDTGGAQKKNNP